MTPFGLSRGGSQMFQQARFENFCRGKQFFPPIEPRNVFFPRGFAETVRSKPGTIDDGNMMSVLLPNCNAAMGRQAKMMFKFRWKLLQRCCSKATSTKPRTLPKTNAASKILSSTLEGLTREFILYLILFIFFHSVLLDS